MSDLFEEHRNFVKHGGIGLVARHFSDIFQLFNLANHLPETLIVVSSDLSHYLPYAVGRRVDTETAEAIVRLDQAPIAHERACGATPVNGLLEVARRRGLFPVLIDLESSGDTAGDRAEVVGYGAFAFYEQGGGDADA